jgi:pimeloyl-ACP methyl ester carboxylesterase
MVMPDGFVAVLRHACWRPVLTLLLAATFWPEAQAYELPTACRMRYGSATSTSVRPPSLRKMEESAICEDRVEASAETQTHVERSAPLIVVGFMGGRVRANNLVHREALLAKELEERYPQVLHAAVFANHDGSLALRTVLRLIDTDGDGKVSELERTAARIIIFGHSWGASETVNLARRLNQFSIPVLLTVQVDSVQKRGENDARIPPNVREAINFYQSDGLLHGRSVIRAADSAQTTILGNYKSSYRKHQIPCEDYPWYARAFMKEHIEIENDPTVWSRIEALIGIRVSKFSRVH